MLWWLELEVEEVAASPNPGGDVGPSDNKGLFAAADVGQCRDRDLRLKSKNSFLRKNVSKVDIQVPENVPDFAKFAIVNIVVQNFLNVGMKMRDCVTKTLHAVTA